MHYLLIFKNYVTCIGFTSKDFLEKRFLGDLNCIKYTFLFTFLLFVL